MPRENPRLSHTLRAIGVMAFAVFAVNAVVMGTMAWDGEVWTGMWVIYILGPLANVLLLLAAVVRAPAVKRQSEGKSIALYVIASIVLPASAYVADVLLVFLKWAWGAGNLRRFW